MEKLRKQGGFTLVEMLIVVAIIAILVAISIPLIGSALEKARQATDAANERAFKTELVAGYLLNEAGMASGTVKVGAGNVYAYDAVNGVLLTAAPTTGYGKRTKDTAVQGYALYGYVKDDGSVVMGWLASDVVPEKFGGETTDAARATVSGAVSTLASPDVIKPTT